MKKLLALIMMITCISVAFADSSANIKIKISGAMKDNRYFLCLPNVGCLSILSAQRGKVYPIFHEINMDNIFVTDANNDFRVSRQGLPSSCNVTVKTNQTITIYGRISNAGANNEIQVSQLHCSVS